MTFILKSRSQRSLVNFSIVYTYLYIYIYMSNEHQRIIIIAEIKLLINGNSWKRLSDPIKWMIHMVIEYTHCNHGDAHGNSIDNGVLKNKNNKIAVKQGHGNVAIKSKECSTISEWLLNFWEIFWRYLKLCRLSSANECHLGIKRRHWHTCVEFCLKINEKNNKITFFGRISILLWDANEASIT